MNNIESLLWEAKDIVDSQSKHFAANVGIHLKDPFDVAVAFQFACTVKTQNWDYGIQTGGPVMMHYRPQKDRYSHLCIFVPTRDFCRCVWGEL